MERSYWERRKLASEDMARRADSAEARLVHYDLAGRYSMKADTREHVIPPAQGLEGGTEEPKLEWSEREGQTDRLFFGW